MPNPTVRSKAADIGLAANPTSTEPVGASIGDVLLAMIHSEDGTAPTPPTGWTSLYSGSRAHGGGDTMLWNVAWIKRGASAPSLAWTTTSGYNEITTVCVQDSDGTIAAQSATGGDAESNTHLPDPPSVGVPTNNNLTVCGGMTWQGAAAGGWGPPTGYTNQGDTNTGTCSCMASKAGVAAGTENPGVFTNGDTHAGPEPMYWDGFTVSFQPASFSPALEAAIFAALQSGGIIGRVDA
jgi:hypothetical protein